MAIQIENMIIAERIVEYGVRYPYIVGDTTEIRLQEAKNLEQAFVLAAAIDEELGVCSVVVSKVSFIGEWETCFEVPSSGG
jgi:hypothetical protein